MKMNMSFHLLPKRAHEIDFSINILLFISYNITIISRQDVH